MGAKELCDEQMFEFGASYKEVRCYEVRTDSTWADNSWNYSIDGHSAFIGTSAMHEPTTSGLPVMHPSRSVRG